MSLETIMKEFNKKNKENLIHVGLSDFNYNRIPFTSPRLNYMTYGGLPEGKLIEFYGENGGGKSTTALDVISNYQQIPDAKKVFYADCENTLDVEWAKKLGVNVDEMVILNPTSQSAETVFQLILDVIETGEVGFVVIDSLGVMVSQQALDKSVEEKTYGGISLALTNFSKKAEMLCKKNKCTLIGINQIRDNLNSPYGGTTTTGGKAWAHNCSVRLEFRKGRFIDENGKEITRSSKTTAGNIVEVYMAKNKTCPPKRPNGSYTLRYDTGIDYLGDLIEVAIRYDIVQQRGAWFSLVDTKTGEVIEQSIQGQAGVKKYLEEHEDILVKVEELINIEMKAD